MKVLTYVNGILTVINEEKYFSQKETKPSFIEEDSFYYEPTLKVTGDRDINETEIVEAEKFIESFNFVASPTEKEKAHYVDNKGNYIGYIEKNTIDNYTEISFGPSDNYRYQYYNGKSFVEAVMVYSDTLYYAGEGYISKDEDSFIYAPKEGLIEGILNNLQFFNLENSKWEISIEDAKKSKLQYLKGNFIEKVKVLNEKRAAYEVDTFNQQKDEAVGYLNDNTYQTPLLDNIILGRGLNENIEDFCKTIIENSKVYEKEYGFLLGLYQSSVKKLKNSISIEEILSIH